MDFTRTEAQDDLARLTRSICDKLVTPDRHRELDAVAGRVDQALLSALADAGVLAAALPEPVGEDLGPLEQGAILRELGRALAGVPYVPSIVMAADALAAFGSAEQIDLARHAAAGETILTAAVEEALTPDRFAPSTTAAPDPERSGAWVLTGSKTAVPYAPESSAILVSATAPDGVGVFVVPTSDVSVTRQEGTDHRSIGLVELNGVRVDPSARLGGDGSGAEVLRHIIDRGTVGVCAEQFGVLERSLEMTSAYAREREQFDRPIGSFQAVAQRLADAFIDVKAARLTQEQAAWRLSEGLDADDAVRIAKFWAADAGHRVAHTTIHVHGGVGLDRDHPAHRYFLAAKHNEFWLGSATEQLAGIGAALAR